METNAIKEKDKKIRPITRKQMRPFVQLLQGLQKNCNFSFNSILETNSNSILKTLKFSIEGSLKKK